MNNTMKSSSHEQREIERYAFTEMERMLQVSLQSNPKLFLTEGVHIEPDFYSEQDKIVGEIFAHQGKTKGGQNHKVAQDILKMLLLEKNHTINVHTIYIFYLLPKFLYHPLSLW